MDATALGPEESRELAALRRRAYGPNPDIADDPAAVSRLADLEAVLHHAGTEHEVLPARAAPPVRSVLRRDAGESAPRRSVDGFAGAAVPMLSAAEAAPAGESPRRSLRAWRPRRRWLVIGGAVALVASLVWGVTQLSEPRSDTTLGRIPAGEDAARLARQGFLDSADVTAQEVQRFEPYEALQIWLVLAAAGDRCLVIEAERYGILGVNCTPPGLDPVLDLRIWRGMRTNIFGDLPPNTFLRFTHHGDRVHVWVRPPAGDA